MKDMDESAVDQYKRDLRRGLRDVAIVCAVVLAIALLIFTGPADAVMGG